MTVGMMIVCHGGTFTFVLFAHECLDDVDFDIVDAEIVITDFDDETKLFHWTCL